MTETGTGSRRVLSNAAVYSFVQRLLGATGARRCLVEDHLRPVPGERLLDLGCGPGDILELLPAVDYVGVDVSSRYVEAARRRFGARATFIHADLGEVKLDPRERFDAVIAIGVLHHLDDRAASEVMGLAANALAPSGRLVTLDPGIDTRQRPLARWLVERDRGRNVRTPEAYAALARRHFASIEPAVRHHLARVPYTHVILECRGPLASGSEEREGKEGR